MALHGGKSTLQRIQQESADQEGKAKPDRIGEKKQQSLCGGSLLRSQKGRS